MTKCDLHAALQTGVVSSETVAGVELVLVKLAWGKEDVAFSLHVGPSTYSLSGLQMTDLLAYMGFTRSQCGFTQRRECYANWANPDLNLTNFGNALRDSHVALIEAQKHFEACGFLLPQPEGWGFHTGRQSGRTRVRVNSECIGDGHTSPQSKKMKQAEDEHFEFVFSWIEGGSDKGWTTHYRPKRQPASPEIKAVFEFLELKPFPTCPMFDFEPCSWRFTEFSPTGFMESNADRAHGWFDSHARSFSPGIERLLTSHRLIEAFGMRFQFLPIGQPAQRREVEIERRIVVPKKGKKHEFDVAISFAGTERALAETLANKVRDAGFQVFYDNFHKTDLWGKDLVEFFDAIYRKRSRYCVMFISKDYAERMWTTLERRSALARWLEEKGNDYILPVRCDDADIPGLPPTIGYLSLKEHSIDAITHILTEKLRALMDS